ncbi:myosin II light chain [Tieghemiomyces parasiticus]|uniref:Myosin II light chain n=1 Tax=Tieghemiomyces parasiticus TaxID=78921 RepID=A0A9W8E1R8_9FUNG|nr:myosin II light chain [Tieghemiomyces parasiticus]KAJ1929745.1 myosin II light chain [Tieghemiomyces parasiticus]
MAATRTGNGTTEEYKEAFSLFDKTGQGHIPLESLGTLLRALGQNPTETELAEIVGDLEAERGAQQSKNVDFDAFLRILQRPGGFAKPSEDAFEEFVQAFQVFDKEGNGFISAGELRYVLTSLGDRLSDEEVSELLKGVETDKNGNIHYEEFVRMLLES